MYSGYGWVRIAEVRNEQLITLRNKERRLSSLHLELDTIIWSMKNMIEHTTFNHFGTDWKELISMIKDPTAWPGFHRNYQR